VQLGRGSCSHRKQDEITAYRDMQKLTSCSGE
jgi:hypothetical protein